MAETKDIENAIIMIKDAQKEHFFGELTLSFRDGIILYFRKNEVRKIDEFINKQQSIDKIK